MVQNDPLFQTTMRVEYQVESPREEICRVEVNSPYIASFKTQFFNLLKHQLNNLEKLEPALDLALSKIK